MPKLPVSTAGEALPAVTRNHYLEPSPYESDCGQKIGKLPGLVSPTDLTALGHPTRPTKAIRAKCLDCCVGNAAEVRKCTSIECPLWPMRMGVNPFYGAGENKPASLEGSR
jgi:hypothetical protein